MGGGGVKFTCTLPPHLYPCSGCRILLSSVKADDSFTLHIYEAFGDSDCKTPGLKVTSQDKFCFAVSAL